GSLLRNLAHGECTILPALEDLVGILSDDEVDAAFGPNSSSRTLSNPQPADVLNSYAPENILDYYARCHWKEASRSMDAELDDTIAQLDDFLSSLYASEGYEETSSTSPRGDGSGRISSSRGEHARRNRYEGRFTREALLRKLHPGLARYLAQPNPNLAREQREYMAKLAR
ncbi:hypothetical protein FOZ63_016963, partial [Perkinsus olseni]